MKKFSKRAYVLVGVVAVAAVAAFGAYAYWTTSGTGSGTATAGTSAAVNATQTSTVSLMRPGGPAQALDFSLNNTQSTNQFVTNVAISIASVTGPNITGGTPCDASDFYLVQPTATYGDLTPGVHAYVASGATLQMVNKNGNTNPPSEAAPAANQDGCKLATVNLTYTVS